MYIAQEGVTTTDLFRRPGNPTDAKIIMKRMQEGKEVAFQNYNFYTLATVVKVFFVQKQKKKNLLLSDNSASLLMQQR